MPSSTRVLRLRATPVDDSAPVGGEVQCCVEVAVDGQTTVAAVDALTERQLGFHRATARADLRAGEEPVGDDEPTALPLELVGELVTHLGWRDVKHYAIEAGLAPSTVGGVPTVPVAHRFRLGRHADDVQVLDHHGAASRRELGGELVDLHRGEC